MQKAVLQAPHEPLGENAVDAFKAAQEADPDGVQRVTLLFYGHFCEVMPEVHRNYFNVTGDKESGFTLEHCSADRDNVAEAVQLAVHAERRHPRGSN